jgi:membrane AbrB-like protein
MAVAIEENADIQKIAIVQLFRLVMLVAVLPFLMVLGGLTFTPSATQGPYIAFSDLMLIALLGMIGGRALKALKMSAPYILGPMLVIGVLRGFGFFPGQYPFELSNLGFILVGGLVGCRFQGITARQFFSIAPAALLSFVVATGLGFTGAVLVSVLIGLPLPISLMAFAPGGLEAMTALAFSLRIDPVRVGVHHIARFTMIGVVLPMILKFRPSWIRGEAK